jgi:opacity protein-like surface antigen
MSRRIAPLTISILGLFAAVCLMSGASPALAAASDREDHWQFYIPITYSSSERIDGEGGSFIDMNSDVGWGFAFGYNFNERWMLGFEITWSQRNYFARVVSDNSPSPPTNTDFSSRFDSSTLAVVGQFNFMETAWTPFIRAGLGSTYIDTNIASAPPQGSCWWHPWWGYICGTWQPTYDSSSFSYQAGLGVRGDIGDAFYLELSYNTLWIDLSHSQKPEISGPRLNIGWLF